MADRRSPQVYLGIYMNDHLMGATSGVALARRAVTNARTPEARTTLERVAKEIAEDRRTLLELMRRWEIRPDPLKVLAGRVAEGVGRLKLNGHLLAPSPLTPLVESEALVLGVTGKRALWRAVRDARSGSGDSQELDVLIERAERQLQALDSIRVAEAREALSDGGSHEEAQAS
jgi:hypothetical protein